MMRVTTLRWCALVFLSSLLFAEVEKGIVLKEIGMDPGPYEAPRNEREAYNQAKEAEFEKKEAERREREAQKKLTDVLQKSNQSKTIPEQNLFAQLAADAGARVKEREQWDARLDQLSKNEYVQKLGLLREPRSIIQSPEQLAAQQRSGKLRDQLKAWFLRRKISFFEFFSANPERLQQLRLELAGLYAKFDPIKAKFESARAQALYTSSIEPLTTQVLVHIDALSKFQEAIKAAFSSPETMKWSDPDKVFQELQNLISDLIILQSEVFQSNDISNSVRKDLSDAIDRSLAQFSMSEELKKDLYEQLGLDEFTLPKNFEEVLAIVSQANDAMVALDERIKANLTGIASSPEFARFAKLVSRLEKADLLALGRQDSRVVNFLDSFYSGLAGRLLESYQQLVNKKDFNTAGEVFDLWAKVQEKNSKLQATIILYSKEAILTRSNPRPFTKVLDESLVASKNKQLESRREQLLNNFTKKNYDAFARDVESWLKIINGYPISDVSIAAKQRVLDRLMDVANSVESYRPVQGSKDYTLARLTEIEGIQSDLMGEGLAQKGRIAALEKEIVVDQSLLVQQKEFVKAGEEPFEFVKISERTPDQFYVDSLDRLAVKTMPKEDLQSVLRGGTASKNQKAVIEFELKVRGMTDEQVKKEMENAAFRADLDALRLELHLRDYARAKKIDLEQRNLMGDPNFLLWVKALPASLPRTEIVDKGRTAPVLPQ